MGDIKTSIIMDLAGNLQRRAGQFSGSLQQLGRRGSASMRMLRRGAAAAGRGIDRLGSRYAALITGAAGVGAARMVGNLEERFTRLGIQANRSTEEMDDLKKKIFETAKAPDIRVDPGRITTAIEEIIEKTGDLKFAEDNIRTIGLALQATGADGKAIGGILAEFQKMDMGAQQVFETLDKLAAQGKIGAFTLQNLAALGPRVVTSYTAMGRSGMDAMFEMGAVLQVIQQGAGSPEQAATSFEALMRVLGDADKIKLLQKGGLKVFDPKELKEGRKVLRPINELVKEIVEKTGGDRSILQRVLGDSEAVRAFNAVLSEFNRTGGITSLDKFFNVKSNGALLRDSARAAGTFNAALTNLYTVWQQFTDDQLAGPVKRLTNALDGLAPGTVERWLDIGKNIAIVGGGLVIAKRFGLFKMGRQLLTRSKRGGLSGAGGLAASAFGDAVPVYVVNGPASLWNPGGKSSVPGKVSATRGASLLAGGAALVPAAAAATLAAVSQQIGKTVGEKQIGTASYSRLKELLDQQMVMGGGPNSYQARMIRKEMMRRESEQMEQHFKGKLDISISNDGSAKVTQLKASHGFDIDVDSGMMMVSH